MSIRNLVNLIDWAEIKHQDGQILNNSAKVICLLTKYGYNNCCFLKMIKSILVYCNILPWKRVSCRSHTALLMLLYYTSDTTHILYVHSYRVATPLLLTSPRFIFFKCFSFFICVCTVVYVHASHAHAGAQVDKKSTLDSLDLQIVISYLMWVWKTKLR